MRWKEELVVTGIGGTFVLELTMGVLSAHLPTESRWNEVATDWALNLWPTLKTELEDWCKANKANFNIEEDAWVLYS
jgi:hypothetical protein